MGYTATEGIYRSYTGLNLVFSTPVPDSGPAIPKLDKQYTFKGEDGGTPVPVLSYQSIEVYDLLCAGEIEGLVSGYYNYSGVKGDVGWKSKDFTPYISPSGLDDTNWLRSVFWNEIPLVDSDGKYNFSSFNVSFSKGTADGYVLTDDTSNNEITVTRPIGERFRSSANDITNRVNPYSDDYSKTYRISNKDVSACYIDIRTPALYNQVVGQDLNTYSTSVVYSIYYRAIYNNPNKIKDFKLAKEEKIEGNINTDYVRRSRIEFPSDVESDFVAWEIRLIRETEDSTSSYLQNKTFIDSITEIYQNNLLYPKSSIARCKFDGREFNGIPSRYYHTRMKKIQVPNNYDPILRTYGDSSLGTTTGAQGSDYWNGEFKNEKEYSNNPAWVMYDILTDKLNGLGNNIGESDLSASKWDLYQISKNCDTLVSDGEGGLEPRFTCNAYLGKKEEAYKVINDLSSVFNGIPYYQGGSIFFSQDRNKDEQKDKYLFNNSNVEDGNFTYFTTSKKNRYTVAVVRYNDKNNYFRPNFEYVEDIDAIKRYGIQEVDLTSFATTSRGQAVRAGRWALESSKQKETISFMAGVEAQTLRIGDIFRVHDSNRKGFYEGGRVSRCFTTGTGLAIDLDREISLTNGKSYELKVLGSTFSYDPVRVNIESSDDYTNIKRNYVQGAYFDNSYIQSLSDGRSRILFPSSGVFDFSGYDLFTNNNVWTVNLASGEDSTDETIGNDLDQYSYYTCVNISEQDNIKYEVIGLEYGNTKFDVIDNDITPDYSENVINQILSGPNNLSLTFDSDSQIIDYEFDPITSPLLSHYEIYIKEGSNPTPTDSDSYFVLSKTTTSGSYSPLSNGTYYFRAYSVSINGNRSSSYTSSSISVSGISIAEGIIISSLQIDPESTLKDGNQNNDSGTTLFEEYFVESPVFSWQVGYKSSFVEKDNPYRITIRPPSSSNTPSPTILYQDTGYQSPFLSDSVPKYSFNIRRNSLDTESGPHRHFDVVVESFNTADSKTSAGNELDASIAAPYVVSETWSNSDGYDILEVNNYPVTGYRLTDSLTGETQVETINTYGSQIATDQWIATDGSIKFTITTGASGLENLPPNINDMYGAYIYYRNSTFTSGDAYTGAAGIGYAEIPLYAESFSFGNVYTADAKLPDTTNEQYISISIMDRFDYFAIKEGNANHRTSLGMSNTVRIDRRGVGASTGNEYVLLSSAGDLPNSKILSSGTGISLRTEGSNVHIDFDPYSLEELDAGSGTGVGDYIVLMRNGITYKTLATILNS